MTDEVKVPTPGEAEAPKEQKTPPVEQKPTVDTPVQPPKEEKTMEQIQAEVASPKERETVGLDKFLDLKKENKELKKSIDDLTKAVQEGATKREISSDIASISDKYPDVDKTFLQELVSTIEARVKAPLEKEKEEARIQAAFQKEFNRTMSDMPEFKDIVDPEEIKDLSLLKKNSNKSFRQIIEDRYGNALTGKRSIEPTAPGGGKEPEPLDFDKARKNTDYFKEVMSNPNLKKEYNKIMLEKGF